MLARNLVSAALLGACFMAGSALAQSQEPAYGMLFQPRQAPVAPSADQGEPPLVLKSRPLTPADVEAAVANTQKPTPTVRTPSPMDLSRMQLPAVPSATPATFEQQQEARMAAWQAQEELRIERERQVRLAQEAEAKKQVIVVQQQDPFLSNILAIPRAIGYLFGGRTVR